MEKMGKEKSVSPLDLINKISGPGQKKYESKSYESVPFLKGAKNVGPKQRTCHLF